MFCIKINPDLRDSPWWDAAHNAGSHPRVENLFRRLCNARRDEVTVTRDECLEFIGWDEGSLGGVGPVRVLRTP